MTTDRIVDADACFHCGESSGIIWGEYRMKSPGFEHDYHCNECGRNSTEVYEYSYTKDNDNDNGNTK